MHRTGEHTVASHLSTTSARQAGRCHQSLCHGEQQAPDPWEHLLFVSFCPSNFLLYPLPPWPSCLLRWCLVPQALCPTGNDRQPVQECYTGSSLRQFEALAVMVVAIPFASCQHPTTSPHSPDHPAAMSLAISSSSNAGLAPNGTCFAMDREWVSLPPLAPATSM